MTCAQIIQDEERSFGEMLDRGIKYFNTIVAELEAQGAPKTIAADKVGGARPDLGTQGVDVLGLGGVHCHCGVRSVSSRHPGCLPVAVLEADTAPCVSCDAPRRSTCTTRWASPST